MMIVIILYSIMVIVVLCLITMVIFNMNGDEKKNSTTEFINLLNILSTLIKTELDAYDQDIFENKGSITNNNFDRYYKDLTQRVLKNISPNIIEGLSYYYTEEAIYRFIGRTVRDYLVSKINGTM